MMHPSGDRISVSAMIEQLKCRLREGIFYGWWLVLFCIFAQAIGVGGTLYIYGIVADAVQEEFHAGRSIISLGLTGMFFAAAFLSPKVGAILDHFSIKRAMMIGAAVTGGGYILMSYSTLAWHFTLTYMLFMTVGFTVLGHLGAATLLARWFVVNRGLAIGVATVGPQVGGIVLAPLLAYLIELFEWRAAFRLFGFSIMVVVPLVASRLVVDRPSDRGELPDGEEPSSASRDEEESSAAEKDELGISLRSLVVDRNFWLATGCLTILMSSSVVTLVNLTIIGTDIGIPRERAAWLIPIISVIGLGAGPVIGRLTDRFDVRRILGAMMLLALLSIGLLAVATGFLMLAAAALIMGFAGGSAAVLWGVIVGRLYDILYYGQVMGTMAFVVMICAGGAPFLASVIFDLTGSYDVAFIGLGVFLFLGFFGTFLIPQGRSLPGRTDRT